MYPRVLHPIIFQLGFPLKAAYLTKRGQQMSRTGFLFTSKFYKKEHTMKIHKFINARYHTIHTNLQMVIYTIIYTQSDPVAIN